MGAPAHRARALTHRRPRRGRAPVVTASRADALQPGDLNRYYELPRGELPEAFPRFDEDSFEATLPRGGCHGLQARRPGCAPARVARRGAAVQARCRTAAVSAGGRGVLTEPCRHVAPGGPAGGALRQRRRRARL